MGYGVYGAKARSRSRAASLKYSYHDSDGTSLSLDAFLSRTTVPEHIREGAVKHARDYVRELESIAKEMDLPINRAAEARSAAVRYIDKAFLSSLGIAYFNSKV